MAGTEDTWFSDIIGDGSQIGDQLKAVKDFAYSSFDKLDKDGNGFLSRKELELALAADLQNTEKKFLEFLLDNHEQICEACDDGRVSADGISRQDLEFYFELIRTLL